MILGGVLNGLYVDWLVLQVDYILGNNNRGQSYLVGFGSNYPDQVHHRGASIVSIKVDSQFVSCLGGYADWYNRASANPNLITGALVGGPDENDDFVDERNAYEMTEPTTYNTAPLVGVLARLQGGGGATGLYFFLHFSAIFFFIFSFFIVANKWVDSLPNFFFVGVNKWVTFFTNVFVRVNREPIISSCSNTSK